MFRNMEKTLLNRIFMKNFDMIFLKLSIYGFFWIITIIYGGNL